MTKKKTNEEFRKDVYNLVADEYSVLGDYKNNRTKITIIHNKCGHVYDVVPFSFLRGDRCPNDICITERRSRLRKTHEEFVKEVEIILDKSYQILTKYNGVKCSVDVKHLACNNTYRTTPASILNGSGCPHCAGNIKKTTDDFKSEVYNLVEDDYEVLGEYLGAHNHIKICHKTCNNIYFVTPSNFLHGKRCPNMNCIMDIRNKFRTTDQFKEEIFDIFGDEYEILGEYYNNHTKLAVRHNICNNIYDATPGNMLQGHGCLECYGRFQRDSEYFIQRVKGMVGDEYSVLSEYTKAKEEVKMIHNTCNYEFTTTPDVFINSGQRCPKCSLPKGEERVINFLLDKNLDCESQYKFDDCRNKKPLPFDFAVFNNGNLAFLIEYDGKQHYQPIEYFGGEESFQMTKTNDTIKNKYCNENNIKLIRIPYWEFDNIETILSEELKDIL